MNPNLLAVSAATIFRGLDQVQDPGKLPGRFDPGLTDSDAQVVDKLTNSVMRVAARPKEGGVDQIRVAFLVVRVDA